MDLPGFFLALLHDWVALMSGIVSIILTVLGFFKRWKEIPLWVYLTAAVLCFFLSCARVWTSEHVRAENLQIRINNEINPHLECTIDQTSYGYVTQDTAKIGKALEIVTIRSKGAPSAAEQFSLTVLGESGFTMKSLIDINPGTITWAYPNGRLRTISSAQMLYSKTAEPIPHLGRKEGYLVFTFPGVPYERLVASARTMELDFKDGEGNLVSCQSTANDQTGPNTDLVFPEADKP